MKIIFTILVLFVTCGISQVLELNNGKPGPCTPPCPKCNPLAGCNIPGCPCTHDGFIMYPGNYPLNPIRPRWCPKCVSNCPLSGIYCPQPWLQCTDKQIASYKCIEVRNVEEEVDLHKR